MNPVFQWIIFTLLILLFLDESASHSFPNEEILVEQKKLRDFDYFVEKYEKKYEDRDEHQMRREIFMKNLKAIEEIQAMEEQMGRPKTSGITKFADMTPEEFRSKILMPPHSLNAESDICDTKHLQMAEPLTNNTVPDSFDWRDHGAVTEVKNQGSVGTCWAFSTTGNIEGQWFLKTGKLISLSEEQLNDCDSYDCGVFGGWPCRAYQYVIQVGGLMSEAEYPYCVGTGDCYPCPPPKYNTSFCGPPPEYCNATKYPCRATPNAHYVAHISSWKKFGTSEQELTGNLVSNGPLSVLMNASGFPPLQYHYWGIYNPWSCDPTALDHAVLIVGYGTDDGTPYWIVKNSWGKDWNEKGYFRIVRGEGKCGINTAVTSSII